MNPFIQYVITLLIIFLIVTLLIKILVIPVFNFYENVNVAIWLSLIIIAGIFFYPKTIFTGYGIPDQSCTCLGIRTSTEETYLKRIVCSGLAYSCYDYSTFKSKAAQSPKLCSNKNDSFLMQILVTRQLHKNLYKKVLLILTMHFQYVKGFKTPISKKIALIY